MDRMDELNDTGIDWNWDRKLLRALQRNNISTLTHATSTERGANCAIQTNEWIMEDLRYCFGFSVFIQAIGSRGGIVFTAIYLCLFFRKISQKPMHKPETFHDELWEPIYYGVQSQRSRSRVTKTMPAWVFALLWVLAFSSSLVSARIVK